MLLTLDEARQFVDWPTGDDADNALQTLLDATEADIATVMGGSVGEVTEYLAGGWTTLIVSRPIASITTVTDDAYGEGATDLEPDDYRYSVGGYVLRRLWGGTNAGSVWGPWVSITYAPQDDLARRQSVQAGLIKATLN